MFAGVWAVALGAGRRLHGLYRGNDGEKPSIPVFELSVRSLAVIVAWIWLLVGVSTALCRRKEGETRAEACLPRSGPSPYVLPVVSTGLYRGNRGERPVYLCLSCLCGVCSVDLACGRGLYGSVRLKRMRNQGRGLFAGVWAVSLGVPGGLYRGNDGEKPSLPVFTCV